MYGLPHIGLMHFRPLPLLTLFAIPSLILLLVLGQWQWQRFVTKKDPAPTPLVQVLDGGSLPADLAPDADFVPVKVSGFWAPGTIRVYAVEDGVRGARWFSALVTDGGLLMVDRGFAPDGVAVSDDDGAATVTGMLRLGARPNRYTPDNDPANSVWYWPDVPALLASQQWEAGAVSSTQYLAVSTSDLAATGRPRPNPFAQPGGANLIPAERHLGYALTWWGLAVALIGVYLAFHARQGRLGFSRP